MHKEPGNAAPTGKQVNEMKTGKRWKDFPQVNRLEKGARCRHSIAPRPQADKEESLGLHNRLLEDIHFLLIWKILLSHTRTDIYL